MSSTTFTPAQQSLHDALADVDADLLHIARQILEAAIDTDFGLRGDEPDPEDYGAPIGTPAWDTVETAVTDYDKATSGMGEKEAALAALYVVNAVLTAKGA